MFNASKSRRSFGPCDVIFRAIVLKLNIIYSSQMSQNLQKFHLPTICGFLFMDQNVQNLTNRVQK